jgi:hypothetical protein
MGFFHQADYKLDESLRLMIVEKISQPTPKRLRRKTWRDYSLRISSYPKLSLANDINAHQRLTIPIIASG